MKDPLIKKLRDRTAVISVIGLGYVGLPLALRFSECGYRVIGLDIDEAKVKQLNKGQSYFRHIATRAVSAARNKGE